MRGRHHRRVTWKVRRTAEGWLPVVLLGEQPLPLPVRETKAQARDAARAQAKTMTNAGV